MDTVGKHYKNISRDFFTYGVMAVLAQMSGLLLLPLLTRALTLDHYGVIDIAVTFIALSSIGMKIALPNAVTRYYIEFKQRGLQNQLIATLTAIVALLGLIIVAVLCMLSGIISKTLFGSDSYAWLLIMASCVAFTESLRSVPQSLLRMERRIVAFNLPDLLYIFCHVSLTLYFVFVLKLGIKGIILSQLCSSVISFIVTIAFTHRAFYCGFLFKDLKRIFKYSFPLLPSFLSFWVNKQADRYILLMIVGLSGVAVFSVSAKLALAVTFLLNVFLKSWQPYAMLIIKSRCRDDLYKGAFKYYMGLFFGATIIMTTFSPELFRVLVPETYYKGFALVPWIVGTAVLHNSSVFTKLGLMVEEKTFGISIASWSAVVVNVVLCVLLVSRYSINGVAIGSFIAELLFTVLLWKFSEKYSDLRFDKKPFIYVLLIFIFSAILIISFENTIDSRFISLLSRVGVLCLSLLLLCKVTLDQYAINYIKAKCKSITLKRNGLSSEKSESFPEEIDAK